jgi:hypothetical protein
MTIGRIGGLIEQPPARNGGQLTIVGTTPVLPYAELTGARHQLSGIVDNDDEPIIPLTFAADPSLDGFYRPVSMTLNNLGPIADAAVSFAAAFEQVESLNAPAIEVTLQSILRPNAVAVTDASPIVFTAFAHTDLGSYMLPFSTAGGATAVFTADSATIEQLRFPSGGVNFFPAPVSYQYQIEPANFYVGACRIERLFGSTWLPILGNALPATIQGQWRISNGMIRFTPPGTYGQPATLEVWDSTAGAWESMNFKRNSSLGNTLGWIETSATARLEILRNSPEHVIVRYTGRTNQETWSLQRGAWHLLFISNNASVGAGNYASGTAVQFSSSIASTALTGGLRSTSNDANGNRWIIASPHACTATLGTGVLALTSNTARPVTFMIGVEKDGSSAAGGNTATDVMAQFFGAVSWRQRIVTL